MFILFCIFYGLNCHTLSNLPKSHWFDIKHETSHSGLNLNYCSSSMF